MYDWKPYSTTPRSVWLGSDAPGAQEKGGRAESWFLHESSSPSPHPAFTDKDNTDYTHRENTMHLKGKEINVSSNVTTPTLIAIFLDAQQ